MEDLNMTQIAQVLNVSEPRISQIHSSAYPELTYMNTYIYE
ncbi:sigma factor-like helix-turn-helix DNA-binding protein [Enterocloster sp.]